MANSAQARKRARQAEATRKRNASLKSELRSAVKKVKKAKKAVKKVAKKKPVKKAKKAVRRKAKK